MATLSAHAPPFASPPDPSPPLKGIKKALSRRRESEAQSDPDPRSSAESLPIDVSPSRNSTRSSPSRDRNGTSIGTGSSIRKFLPGHAKRQRRKIREEELRIAADEAARGRTLPASRSTSTLNRSTSSLNADADASLLTDDDELET